MLTVMLFDDERLALKTLEIQLGNFNNIQITGMYTTYADFVAAAAQSNPDIAFIDIETPCKNGLEIAREIKGLAPATEIVFVTAHRHYAWEAFEIAAADYILKPVKKERLGRIIDKVEQTRGRGGKDDGITVQMMKRFEVRNHAGEVIGWRTRKVRELMAYLVHHRGRVVTTDSAVEALWPEENSEKAKKLLYTTMYYLRKDLQRHGARVETRGSKYFIPKEQVQCDADELDTLIRRVDSDSNQVWPFLDQFFALYRGEYLEENHYEWARKSSAELEARMVSAVIKSAASLLRQNRLLDAESALKRLVLILPYHENPYKMLMEIYQRLNDRLGMEKTYQAYCKMMIELGLVPEKKEPFSGR